MSYLSVSFRIQIDLDWVLNGRTIFPLSARGMPVGFIYDFEGIAEEHLRVLAKNHFLDNTFYTFFYCSCWCCLMDYRAPPPLYHQRYIDDIEPHKYTCEYISMYSALRTFHSFTANARKRSYRL